MGRGIYAFNAKLGRQRQVHLCEFKVGLTYRGSSRQPELHSETLFQKTREKKLLREGSSPNKCRRSHTVGVSHVAIAPEVKPYRGVSKEH